MAALLVAAALVGIALVGSGYWALWQSRTAAEEQFMPAPLVAFPERKPLAEFTLVDDEKGVFDLKSLESRWSFIFFGFMFCPDICPTTLAQLKLFYQELDPEVQADTQIWLVSVDPARDTPEQLDSYLEFFHPAFRGMTGDFLEIHRFATALNIPFAKVPGGGDEYMVDHSANVALVNPEGHSVGFFKAPLDISKMQRNFLTIREHYY